MDALRTAFSVWGATNRIVWPPTVEQAREITAMAPSALAAFGRLRQGLEPIEPDPELDTTAGFLYQLNGELPDEASARALDAYFIVGADHGFNASTFTARVITSTRSDIASAVARAPPARSRARCMAAPRRRSSASSTRSARRRPPRSGSTAPSTAASG